MTKFQVGDRVVVDDRDDPRWLYAGTIVETSDESGAEPTYVVREVPAGGRAYERIRESQLALDASPAALDLHDPAAILAELVDVATADGRYSIRSEHASERIHNASRIAFLAARLVWLDSILLQAEERKARARAKAEQVIADKIAAGELIRLDHGGLISRAEFDPARHVAAQ